MANLDKEVKNELLYDDSYLPIIVNKWKQTEVDHSARDYLHENRVGLTIPGVTYRELYTLGIQEGFVRCLFSFELALTVGNDEELMAFLEEEVAKLKENKS